MYPLAAVVFLLGVGLAGFIYVISLLRLRGRYSLWEICLYSLAYWIARTRWRVTIHAKSGLLDSLPSGAILVANHRCSVDPFFIQLAAGRRVHWMVAGEYCRHPLFGPLLRLFEVIPTNRGGIDTASTKQAIRLVRSGKWVGMFPEGRINRTDQPLLTLRPGAAMVAVRGEVPIVPIWIRGAPATSTVWGPFFASAVVDVFVGEPIFPQRLANGEMEEHQPMLERVMKSVGRLGGYDDLEIAFAGRRWLEKQSPAPTPEVRPAN